MCHAKVEYEVCISRPAASAEPSKNHATNTPFSFLVLDMSSNPHLQIGGGCANLGDGQMDDESPNGQTD